MRAVILALMSLLVLLSSASLAAQADAESRLTFHITDNFGNPLVAKRITMRMNGSAIQVLQDQPWVAPYGKYVIEAEVPGFDNASELITVNQPEEVIALAMHLGGSEASPPSCRIDGHVAPPPVSGMRAIQIFGSYMVDIPVTSKGTFQLEHLECGDYLLVARRGKECIGTKLIRITPNTTKVEMRFASPPKKDACTSGLF